MVQVDNRNCFQRALCCLTCGLCGKPSEEGVSERTPFTDGAIETSEKGPPASPHRSPYHPPSVDPRPLTPTSDIGNEDTHRGGGDVSPIRDGLRTDQRV